MFAVQPISCVKRACDAVRGLLGYAYWNKGFLYKCVYIPVSFMQERHWNSITVWTLLLNYLKSHRKRWRPCSDCTCRFKGRGLRCSWTKDKVTPVQRVGKRCKRGGMSFNSKTLFKHTHIRGCFFLENAGSTLVETRGCFTIKGRDTCSYLCSEI